MRNVFKKHPYPGRTTEKKPISVPACPWFTGAQKVRNSYASSSSTKKSQLFDNSGLDFIEVIAFSKSSACESDNRF